MRQVLLISAVFLTLPPLVGRASGEPSSVQTPEVSTVRPTATAVLTGRVLDPTGAPLVGAQVTAQPGLRGASALNMVTNERGEFRLHRDWSVMINSATWLAMGIISFGPV